MARTESKIPKSLIPREDVVTVASTVPPKHDDGSSTFDQTRRQWVKQVFPSAMPAGRQNVSHLEQWIEDKQQALARDLPAGQRVSAGSGLRVEFLDRLEMAVDASVGKTKLLQRRADDENTDARVLALPVPESGLSTDDILAHIKKGQRVFSIAFNEVVRQVSVNCLERGQLLAKIWSGYMRMFDLMERVSDPLKDDVDTLQHKLLDQLHLRQDRELDVQQHGQRISELQADLEAHALHEKVLEREVEKAQRVLVEKDLLPFADAKYRTWADMTKEQLLQTVYEMHEGGAEFRQTQRALKAANEHIEHLKQRAAFERHRSEAVGEDLAETTSRFIDMTDRYYRMKAHSERLQDELQSARATIAELQELTEQQAAQLAKPPPVKAMWPDLPSDYTPKLMRFRTEIAAKEATIAALKEHIRKMSVFKLPDEDGDLATNAFSMSMIDPTAVGTQTDLDMAGMQKLQDSAVHYDEYSSDDGEEASYKSHVSHHDLSAFARGGKSRPHSSSAKRGRSRKGRRSMGGGSGASSMDIMASSGYKTPKLWSTLLSGLSSKRKVGDLSLARLKRTILNCYIEKLKVDAATEGVGQASLDMPPFTVDFFFNSYGVKSLVQVKLKQLVHALAKHVKSDPRSHFFARVVGFMPEEPVSDLQFGLFLNALAFLVRDLHENNVKWITTKKGATWIPESAASACLRKFYSSGERGSQVADELFSQLVRRKDEDLKKNLAHGVQRVDLDEFLGVLSLAYESTEERLISEWDGVFRAVDHDENNVLDLDEFIEAIGNIPDLKLQAYHARQAFIEATADMSVEVLDLQDFRKLVSRLFHDTNAYAVSSRRLQRGDSSASLRSLLSLPDASPTASATGTFAGAARAQQRRAVTSLPLVSEDAALDVPELPTTQSSADAAAGGPSAVSGGGRGSPIGPAAAAAKVRLETAGAVEDRTLLLPKASSLTQAELEEFQAVFSHDHDLEFQELKEVWGQLQVDVERELASKHQSPKTRLMLITRAAHVNQLMDKLLRDNDLVADVEDSKELFSTWRQVKQMIKEVKTAVRRRRRASAAFLQKVVRDWSAKAVGPARGRLKLGPTPATSHSPRALLLRNRSWRARSSSRDITTIIEGHHIEAAEHTSEAHT